MRSDGTFVTTCMASPPTSRPAKTNEDRIVHSGLSPPNSATTIPLKPAEPVKPVRLPSVTMRCEMLPYTSIEPAMPHSAPLSVSASVVVRATRIPA